jgi:hypothetical protein
MCPELAERPAGRRAWRRKLDAVRACCPRSHLASPYLPPEAVPSPVLLLAQLWELAHAARLLSPGLTLAELCEQARRARRPGAAVQACWELVSCAARPDQPSRHGPAAGPAQPSSSSSSSSPIPSAS